MRNRDRRWRGGRGGGGGHGHGGGHHQHHGNRQHHNRPQQQQPNANNSLNLERVFGDKVPITPHEWICLEKGSDDISMRAVDLMCPIGKGQRGLIVAPPKVGKTTFLKQLCQSAMASEPNLKAYVLLVDERPEEVTDFKRSVKAEVHASSNDRPFEEHVRVAENLFRKACDEVAAGADVLILLDSLTRLSRVHNAFAPGSRTMSGGLDSRAMEVPRRFFGAARKLEGGGSLTILASILVQTGSKMDDIIFQEFKGTGNMELVLSRACADQRLFPALDIKQTGTRREEQLLPADYLQGVWKLRRALAGLGDIEATRKLIDLLRAHKTNKALVAHIQSLT